MNVGFVGLGAMGAPMTARLVAAFPGQVSVFDVNPDTLAAVAATTGARAVASLGELAGGVDILLTCVPDNSVLREIYIGPDGIASAIRAGTISIDCSTVGPDATRDVHAAMRTAGGSHLDASMLGSVKQANEGTISFVVGGDAEAFEAAQPVLAACGQMIRHCGPSGAGNHMKLIHQTLVAGHAVAVAEALGLCLETGADIETFFDIVTQGTGFAYSRYFENRVPRMRDGDFSSLFALTFMLKDARLALDMTEGADTKFPALAEVVRSFEEAEAAGHARSDFSAVMKAIEARIGKAVTKSGA